MHTETRLYQARKQGLEELISGLRKSLNLVQQESTLTRSLAEAGAASNVEVLKLQREVSELQLKITDRRSEYMVLAREELGKAKAEADSLESVIKGRSDSLLRLTLRSPVRVMLKVKRV